MCVCCWCSNNKRYTVQVATATTTTAPPPSFTRLRNEPSAYTNAMRILNSNMGTCFGSGILLYLRASRGSMEIDCSSFDCSSCALAASFACRKRWPSACRAPRRFARSSVGCHPPVSHCSVRRLPPVPLLVCCTWNSGTRAQQPAVSASLHRTMISLAIAMQHTWQMQRRAAFRSSYLWEYFSALCARICRRWFPIALRWWFAEDLWHISLCLWYRHPMAERMKPAASKIVILCSAYCAEEIVQSPKSASHSDIYL